MNAERKCFSCRLSADNPDVTPDQRLAAAQHGGLPRICLARPPQVVMIPPPQGWGMALMYPTITAHTVSCADFEPEFLNG